MLHLYVHPISQPSRAIIWFCVLNKIPFKPHLINIFAKDQLKPDFLKMNPNHKIPVMRDTESNITLHEGAAILQYLAEKYSSDYYPPLTSKDPESLRLRAYIHQYISWHQPHLRQGTANYSFLVSILPFFKPHARIPPLLIKQSKKILDQGLALLENHWLGGNSLSSPNYRKSEDEKKYLCGSKLTICDFFCFSELMTLLICTSFTLDPAKFPRLLAWIDRMKQLDHFDSVHADIIQLGKQIKSSTQSSPSRSSVSQSTRNRPKL